MKKKSFLKGWRGVLEAMHIPILLNKKSGLQASLFFSFQKTVIPKNREHETVVFPVPSILLANSKCTFGFKFLELI